MSRTVGPGGPVATPMFASGQRSNQCTGVRSSVVASLTPCAVSGTLPRGLDGQDGPAKVQGEVLGVLEHAHIVDPFGDGAAAGPPGDDGVGAAAAGGEHERAALEAAERQSGRLGGRGDVDQAGSFTLA